ncbi:MULTISPECIES: hypothetical protein [Streptomyces]|uniref:Uncharacterized protein n=1 Tax=Streptomyces fradiae ATCC 10745 = DSM 40063 TaxID=1319510 RepID=A0A1Y2NNJ4_STRFR|nr:MULTISPECIES: hypothetical protein [Streptomyces]KAF0646286.1 hypothetical protein K701_29415 [Streptomyces fradiae ATCC 10745 = DSM 40063]OSY49072.1 hypothetical protein BG846_05311 [Streptomyces fradiae ATCC 10745 = DSM 40063]
MTPRTRSRLQAAAQQLAEPPPVHLRGQTAIPLTWQQDALWGEPALPARPRESPVHRAPQRQPTARPRRAMHWYDLAARPATRPRASYTRGRHVTEVSITGPYL